MISKFEGNYYFLSNFYSAPITYNGITYKNNEAAFQAQKCPYRVHEFTDLEPSEAKRLGRRVKLREDWEEVKDRVMYEIVRAKFRQNKLLKMLLLQTGTRTLVEGNWWNDTYWGVCKGKGENKLGQILMRVREELKDD